MSKVTGGMGNGEDAVPQTCLQCYRKTVAPLLLKCQHFICISCLKEQLTLTKGGLYNEYKCKVCGLFTDLSHLNRVFIDNQSFNMFEPEDMFYPSPDQGGTRGQGRTTLVGSQLIKPKPRSPSKKRIEVTSTNVANLNEKAEDLINALQVNKKITGDAATRTSKDIFKSQYLDPVDYSKCIKHLKELIFIDKDSMEFYCVDCITDPSLKLDARKLTKIKKESALVKEKSKQAVMQLSQLQHTLESNVRAHSENESTCQKMKKEIKSVVQNQFASIYTELKLLEARYEEWAIHVLESEAQESKENQIKYLKLLGMVTGIKSNFNQLDNFSDIVSNICRWKRLSKECNIKAEIHRTVKSGAEMKTL